MVVWEGNLNLGGWVGGWVGVTICCVMTRIMVVLHIKISLMTILTIMNKNDDEDFKGGYRET